MTSELRAFHGEEGLKEMYLARVLLHREADELIQGVGWDTDYNLDGMNETRGCAVGCTLEAYDHALYPIELGVPEVLAYLEDRLFELQTPADAKWWPEKFLDAIPVGADLSGVWPKWAIWMLVDPKHGVIRYAGDRADVRSAIEHVADLYRRGGTAEEFRSARDPAAAAHAAAEAARAAAWAAWAAWAAGAAPARYEWIKAACEKLLELLAAAPGGER